MTRSRVNIEAQSVLLVSFASSQQGARSKANPRSNRQPTTGNVPPLQASDFLQNTLSTASYDAF